MVFDLGCADMDSKFFCGGGTTEKIEKKTTVPVGPKNYGFFW